MSYYTRNWPYDSLAVVWSDVSPIAINSKDQLYQREAKPEEALSIDVHDDFVMMDKKVGHAVRSGHEYEAEVPL